MKKFFVFFFLILIDQILKSLALKGLLKYAGGLFVYSCNPNIAWNIHLLSIIFWIFWLASVFTLLYLLKKFSFNIFLISALAGAVSNIFDRFLYGCVIDYIKIFLFPVFNIADAAITMGIIFFILSTKNKKLIIF